MASSGGDKRGPERGSGGAPPPAPKRSKCCVVAKNSDKGVNAPPMVSSSTAPDCELWCAACGGKDGPVFGSWDAFDSHVEQNHAAVLVDAPAKRLERYVKEVTSCEETMRVLETLVVENEGRPTEVFQDAGYLTTDVLRRMHMTTNREGCPQPNRPIGPFMGCGEQVLFILMCVYRWRGSSTEAFRKSALRYFARDNGPSPKFVSPKGITYHQILVKQLTGEPLTAEENKAIWLVDGYTSSYAVPWESIREQLLYLGPKHIYLYMPASEMEEKRAQKKSPETRVVVGEETIARMSEFFSTNKAGMLEGIAVGDIAKRLSLTEGETRATIGHLADEGLVYSTIDDDHYASTLW